MRNMRTGINQAEAGHVLAVFPSVKEKTGLTAYRDWSFGTRTTQRDVARLLSLFITAASMV